MIDKGEVRVTANFTTGAHDTLVDLAARTGMSKTDVVNKAIGVYSVVEDLLDRGGGRLEIAHRDGGNETIYIL
jgi:hypothetical protein